MVRKKYTAKTTEKISSGNYKDLLKIETNGKYTFQEDYISSKIPIDCRHEVCGNIWKVAPYEVIKRGSGCPKCALKSSSEKQRWTLDDLKNKLNEEFGYMPYKFMSEYLGAHTKMTVECIECGTVQDISPNNMVHSTQNKLKKSHTPVCVECGNKRTAQSTSKDKDHFISKIKEKYGYNPYTILEYKNMNNDTKLRCNKCKYEFTAKPGNILLGGNIKHYCPSCNNMIRDNRSYEERLMEATNNTIVNLEPYKSRKIEILHECKKCKYKWNTSPDNRLGGEGCPKCANIISQSKAELEVISFIENDLGIKDIVTQNRTILKGKELDIYLPSHKLGIEINGTYWHCSDYKSSSYHLEKTENCKKQGINLIHIFDDEWDNKKDIVKNTLENIIFDKDNVLSVDNCYVEEIDNDFKNEFLNINHILGTDMSTIKLGLWHEINGEEILISVMTFNKLDESFNTTIDYELVRFATDNEYSVVGAFGKLFTYFKRNYQFKTIITYADRRYSQENLYIKNGFEFSHNSKPSYWYINKNTRQRYHRYNFRKQKLKSLFPEIYNDDKTEFQIMDETRIYKRLWDCGNMVFIYENDDMNE